MPDAKSVCGLMIPALSSLRQSLRQRESTRYLTLQSHLLPGADDAPLMLPTVSTPFRTMTLLSWRQHVDQFGVGCGSLSTIMSAAGRTRDTILPTQPSQTTFTTSSNECWQWPCQAPSHADKACGLGGDWTVGRRASEQLVEHLHLSNLHTGVVPWQGARTLRSASQQLVAFVVARFSRPR